MIRFVDSLYFYGSFSGTYAHDLVYDASGNPTGRTYDNKLNMNRTNSVWMFITRDYSVNNPFTAKQYNDKELPVFVIGGQLSLIPGTDGPEYHIEYNCN